MRRAIGSSIFFVALFTICMLHQTGVKVLPFLRHIPLGLAILLCVVPGLASAYYWFGIRWYDRHRAWHWPDPRDALDQGRRLL